MVVKSTSSKRFCATNNALFNGRAKLPLSHDLSEHGSVCARLCGMLDLMDVAIRSQFQTMDCQIALMAWRALWRTATLIGGACVSVVIWNRGIGLHAQQIDGIDDENYTTTSTSTTSISTLEPAAHCPAERKVGREGRRRLRPRLRQPHLLARTRLRPHRNY